MKLNMNNKGMTLMEVLVSLVLISIVMIFIVNLLSDLKNEDAISAKRNEDTLTRAALINVIQGDLINSDNYLETIIKKSNDSGYSDCTSFKFHNSGTKYLCVHDTFVAYGKAGNLEKWDLNNGTYDLNNIKIECVTRVNSYPSPSLLTIHIPVIGVDSSAKNKYSIELTALSPIGKFTCRES